MAVQKLSENAALSPGARLWVMAGAPQSRWLRRVDWYLNFQAARAEHHQAPRIAPGLVELLRAEGLSQPTTLSRTDQPLMIACGPRLPADYVVQIKFIGDGRQWCQSAVATFNSMGRLATRIFLPATISWADFQAAWPAGDDSAVTLVSEGA